MFEIATQFNAIFRTQQTSQQPQQQRQQQHVSVSLLSMWTSRRVQTFLKIVSSQLNQMDDSASLRDALDACVFFSGSMGRLGADFTSQLPPIFESRMVAIVLHHWKEGTAQLSETLKICRDAGVAAPLISTSVGTGDVGIDSSGGDGTSSSSSSSYSTMMPPPRQLMALPPLGRLVNACLTGLNELRRCLLPGIFARLRHGLEQEFLLETKNILHSHERAVMAPGLRGEASQLRSIAKELKEMTKTIVFPYCRGAMELSLGNEVGANEHFDKLRSALAPPPPATAVETTSDDVSSNPTSGGEGIDNQRGEEPANMGERSGDVQSGSQ
jgi:hypothetical protein